MPQVEYLEFFANRDYQIAYRPDEKSAAVYVCVCVCVCVSLGFVISIMSYGLMACIPCASVVTIASRRAPTNSEDLTVAHGMWKSSGHKRYERWSTADVANIPANMVGAPLLSMAERAYRTLYGYTLVPCHATCCVGTTVSPTGGRHREPCLPIHTHPVLKRTVLPCWFAFDLRHHIWILPIQNPSSPR